MFTADNELPTSLISSIYQDQRGFIWIATENGLVRYDGARFVTYNHSKNDTHSLAHDFVTGLVEDHEGHLYVSTYTGIQRYDYLTDSFSENVKWEDGRVFGENANMVMCDNQGNIYSSGYSIAKVIVNESGELIAQKVPMTEISKNYSRVLRAQNGAMIATSAPDKIYYETTNGEFVPYIFKEKNASINDIVQTQDGVVYVAVTGVGVCEFDLSTYTFKCILPELSSINLSSLHAYGDKLYILTEASAVFVYDRRRKTLTNYDTSFGNSSLSDHSLTGFIIDRDENIWIGIPQKGLMMIEADNSPFRYIGSNSPEVDFIGKNPVSAIYKDSKGNMWVGTNGEGCYRISAFNKENIKHFDKPANVSSFYEDAKDRLWITGVNGGVALFDEKKDVLKQWAMVSKYGPIPTAHNIVEDNHGRMWVATMGYGLFGYDDATNAAYSVNDINAMIHKWITAVHIDDDGVLWACTYDGLEKINIDSKLFDSERFLKRTIVYNIVEDKAKTLWLATSDGLFNMSRNGDTLNVYTIEEGLPCNSLSALQIDNDGVIWASSNNGLAKVDPASGTIVNFYSGDGLQGNEFCKGSSYKDEQDRLWFGGNHGISYFSSNDVRGDSRPWHVRIVALTLGNEDVTTETLSGGKNVTSKPIFETDRVSLAHGDNAFNIYFATEELNSPDKLQFEYRLNDQSWQRLPVGVHSVTFSNLASGAYDFSVRAVNNQRGSTVSTLRIVIRPVWYETWWAYSLIAALVMAFLTLIFMLIRSHYREKNEKMLSERQEAMHDAQTRLFIDITHEIRTPLTLILEPVKKLISLDNDASRGKSYNTILRNANRILRLMEQMIDVRKIDKGVLQLHFEETNIVNLLNSVYEDFQEQANLKHIDLTYVHEQLDVLPVWVDQNYFDKIAINLVSNALKYTQPGGKVCIALKKLGNNVQIEVIDNGPGIPVSERDRIFDRFYRGSNAEGTKITGSGIGLSLTHSLVELHHGTIAVKSSTEDPSGSTFIVTLPLGNAHLSEDDMILNVSMPENAIEETVENVAVVEDDPVHTKTKFRILVVDDEDEINNYLNRELSPDFHVTSCYNGKEALNLLQQFKFDLIVSDVMMPVMDGEALCRKVRQNINLNHMPIILLTANTDENAIISGLDNGADEYLTKPVSINLLRTRIYNLIHNRQMLYNNFSGKQDVEDKLTEIKEKSPDEILMERIMRIINANMSNPDLTVEMLADKVGMSRVHLNRKLKELTNQTARDFIRNTRLKQAATLLAQKKYQINRIAELVGFNNAGNFTTAFRQLYGVSPKDYKE